MIGISWDMPLEKCLKLLKDGPQNFVCRYYNGKKYDFGFHPSPHVIVESYIRQEANLYYQIRMQFSESRSVDNFYSKLT